MIESRSDSVFDSFSFRNISALLPATFFLSTSRRIDSACSASYRASSARSASMRSNRIRSDSVSFSRSWRSCSASARSRSVSRWRSFSCSSWNSASIRFLSASSESSCAIFAASSARSFSSASRSHSSKLASATDTCIRSCFAFARAPELMRRSSFASDMTGFCFASQLS